MIMRKYLHRELFLWCEAILPLVGALGGCSAILGTDEIGTRVGGSDAGTGGSSIVPASDGGTPDSSGEYNVTPDASVDASSSVKPACYVAPEGGAVPTQGDAGYVSSPQLTSMVDGNELVLRRELFAYPQFCKEGKTDVLYSAQFGAWTFFI